MSNQLLIYENAIPLSKDRHAKHSIQVDTDYSYTKNLNALPVLAAEFVPAAREYPIVFSRTGEDIIQPVVLLSLRGKENLFIDGEGQWTADYVPAFLRRYPFIFARSQSGTTFTLCVDEAYKGFNSEDKGERLFTSDGEPTPYVNNVLQFLQGFQAEHDRTQAFCKKLEELDLFETQNAVWTSPTGEKVGLTGFMCVSREKLAAVPPKMLSGMVSNGELDRVYAHLYSLNNFNLFKEKLMATSGTNS